ncbi:MAG: ferredoxin [Rhodospirillales bacterium]|nr:ferredoxin [Rhodospirillales bacterium]
MSTHPIGHVVSEDGTRRSLEAEPGQSLMTVLREHDLPLAAICGGCLSCATCHVYVDAAWVDRLLPPESGEIELLACDPTYRPGASRLSCQIQIVDEIDGLVVTVAPQA